MLRSRSRHLTKTSKENGQHTNELVPEIQRELKLEGLYTQRSVLDELIKRNKITNEVATQIRETSTIMKLSYHMNQMNRT